MNVSASNREKKWNPVLLTLGLEFLPLNVIIAHDKAREASSSVLKCSVFLAAESTVFITSLKSCCKENNNPNKFGWGLTLNTELLTMTRHGLRNVYQSFRDFGLILWHPLVPPGVAECSIDPPFRQAVFLAFHCLCFSGTFCQIAQWCFAEPWGIFLYLLKSIAFLWKLDIPFWLDGFSLFLFNLRGGGGWSFTPRGTHNIFYLTVVFCWDLRTPFKNWSLV